MPCPAASLQAAHEAKKRGCAQVLWLDQQRDGIEEVGTMNVFFVFKNEIVTPILNGSIPAGGVRNTVLQLLRRENQNVVERRITIQEVTQRHEKGELLEAFGAGTAAVITPIGEFIYRDETFNSNHNHGTSARSKRRHLWLGLKARGALSPSGLRQPGPILIKSEMQQ